MITKLSRKDIKMLESSFKNDVSKSALEEYLSAHKKAETAWKVFRDSLVLSEGSSEDNASKEVRSEKVRKFKAGDKVRVLSTAGDVATVAGLSVGDITEVVAYKGDSPKEWDSNSKRQVIVKGLNYFAESALELVVEEEKSPNELRMETIEYAKEFIKKNEGKNMLFLVGDNHFIIDTIFIINPKKNTVVVLLKDSITDKIRAKSIAKCHSEDVFNEHIGKAIALGRALGKDVSEFENAVQPTVPVAGHKLSNELNGDVYEVTAIIDIGMLVNNATGLLLNATIEPGIAKILDDTKAQY